MELRSEAGRRRGLPLTNRLLGRAWLLGRLGSSFTPLSNVVVQSSISRSVLERFAGIDRRREMPRFARNTFLGGRRGKPGSRTDKTSRPAQGAGSPGGAERGDALRRVAYFVGCFANYYDVAVAEAAVSLLEMSGASVVLPEQGCCGIPHLVNGNRDAAKKEIAHNLKALAPLAAEGVDIVTTCPTCALALRQEYLDQWDGDEARVVSEHTCDIMEYLEDRGGTAMGGAASGTGSESPGEVEASGRLRLLHKTPCHLLAQGADGATRWALDRLAEWRVIDFEDSCCGMAGTFGFKRKHYDLSMQIGARLFRGIVEAAPDLVVTSCGMCKIQIEQGTGLAVRHPVEMVAQAVCGPPGQDRAVK
jgi:glycerol-3-phosphate dehydrogenase subunit C